MQSAATKKEQVEEMFDKIAHRYDFLNHLLSMGIDKAWRRRAVKFLQSYKPQHLLDMACGTGDLAFAAQKRMPSAMITGVDLSEGMLRMAKEKAGKKALSSMLFQKGDSENLGFADNTFDAASVGFGVRNFEHLEAGLLELNRVLKPGSPLAILEFSKPRVFPVKQLFNLYFKTILPMTGRLISKDKRAYTYLPESVNAFPEGKDFVAILERCNFKNCRSRPLSFGICTLYTAEK